MVYSLYLRVCVEELDILLYMEDNTHYKRTSHHDLYI